MIINIAENLNYTLQVKSKFSKILKI